MTRELRLLFRCGVLTTRCTELACPLLSQVRRNHLQTVRASIPTLDTAGLHIAPVCCGLIEATLCEVRSQNLSVNSPGGTNLSNGVVMSPESYYIIIIKVKLYAMEQQFTPIPQSKFHPSDSPPKQGRRVVRYDVSWREDVCARHLAMVQCLNRLNFWALVRACPAALLRIFFSHFAAFFFSRLG